MKTEYKKLILHFLKMVLITFGVVAKVFWNTSIIIASLFAYNVLLIALVSYYGIDQSSINNLMDMTLWLMSNWDKFFITIFFLDLYFNRWRFRE